MAGTKWTADTYNDTQLSTPWQNGVVCNRPFSFNLSNTAGVGLTGSDTIKLCPIPYKENGYGCLVTGFHIEIPELDTGATIRLSIGDTNSASNAFQATYASAVLLGSAGSSVVNELIGINNATTVEGIVRGVVPKQYTAAAVYTQQGSTYPVIDFMLQVSTGPGVGVTTGIIKGFLKVMPLQASSVTF